MTTLVEGNLEFAFDDDCSVTKYDEWSFYRNHFMRFSKGQKAVDFLCIHGDIAWLIEVKDYSAHGRTRPTDIEEEVALKVRDTLAGLAAAQAHSNSDVEKAAARSALTKKWRIALHLEQSGRRTKLHPRVADPKSLGDALKRMVKAVDRHPVIVDSSSVGCPWSVQRVQRASA